MCKWRIAANHRVSINSKKPLREAFPLPADRSILRANAWKACGGRSGGGGGGVLSQSSDRSTGFISCHTFMFKFQGWVNATLMFYAGYPASKLIFDSGVVYNLPLAYLLVGMFYFLIILFTMVHR